MLFSAAHSSSLLTSFSTSRMRRRQREEVDGLGGVGGSSFTSAPSTRNPAPSLGVDGALARSEGQPLAAPPPSRRVALRMMEEEERCKPLVPGGDDENEDGGGGRVGIELKAGLSLSEPVSSRHLESIRKAIARVEGRRMAQERRKTCGIFQRTNDMRVGKQEWYKEDQKSDTSIDGCGDEGLVVCQMTEGSHSDSKEVGGDERLVTVLAGLDKLLALEQHIRALERQKGAKYGGAGTAGTELFLRAASADSFSCSSRLSSFLVARDRSSSDQDNYNDDDVHILARRKAILVASRERSWRGGMLEGQRSVATPTLSLCNFPMDSGQPRLRRWTVHFGASRCHTAPGRTFSQGITSAHACASILKPRKPVTADGRHTCNQTQSK